MYFVTVRSILFWLWVKGEGGVFCNCKINIVLVMGEGGGVYFVTVRSILFWLWVKGGGVFCNCKINIVLVMGEGGGGGDL